ncbi:unnamed protein product [Somion occarium]|uniref:Cytochrome P450 n=1 Tax=Somion occarium TaxID=3059160 RepID=A0ABP1E2D6_9APHY
MSPAVVLSLTVIFCAWLLRRLSRIGSRERGLPPGPPTLPLIGNLHQFPMSFAHVKFMEWAQVYGDIISVKLGPQTVVVLSSPSLVRECIDLRSATTSDRPTLHIPKLLYDDNGEMSLARYGPTWKAMRRAARDILSHEACMKHLPIQHAEAGQLMYDLLEHPKEFYTHIYRYSASVIFSVVAGIHCSQFEGSVVEDLDSMLRQLEYILRPGGSPPVDLIPLLKYIPSRWALWKTKAKEVRAVQEKLFFGILDHCVDRIKREKRNDCFLEYVLDHQSHYGLDYRQMAYLGGTLFMAGADTTAVFLRWFIACMVTYPDIQKRAQQEVDEVIGLDKSPVLDDIEKLPYLRAIIKEVHRFRPITPTAVPHSATADERVGDFLIPKGATIFMNVWAIYHHEDYFDNPELFNPERYIRSEHGAKPGVDTTGLRDDLMFGGGRRICPGSHLASNSIFLNTMDFLWAFKFQPATDEVTGLPIPIDLNSYNGALIGSPTPFQCEIIPRSEAKAGMIREQFAAASPTFELFEQHTSLQDKPDDGA